MNEKDMWSLLGKLNLPSIITNKPSWVTLVKYIVKNYSIDDITTVTWSYETGLAVAGNERGYIEVIDFINGDRLYILETPIQTIYHPNVPGFELIFLLSAIGFLLFFKRRKKHLK